VVGKGGCSPLKVFGGWKFALRRRALPSVKSLVANVLEIARFEDLPDSTGIIFPGDRWVFVFGRSLGGKKLKI